MLLEPGCYCCSGFTVEWIYELYRHKIAASCAAVASARWLRPRFALMRAAVFATIPKSHPLLPWHKTLSDAATRSDKIKQSPNSSDATNVFNLKTHHTGGQRKVEGAGCFLPNT